MNCSRLLAPLLLLVLLPGATAWCTPEDDARRLDQELYLLDIARTLNLTQAQCQALLPILEEVQTAFKARDAGIEDVWMQSKDAIAAVNKAWETRTAPDPTAKATADQAGRAHQAIIKATRQAVDAAAEKARAVLTAEQRALIETPQQAELRRANQALYRGAGTLAEFLARDIAALRELRQEEYDAARVALAMNLATRVATMQDPNFRLVLNQALEIEDTWRRMPDAEYNRLEDGLPELLAQFLQTPEDAQLLRAPVTLDDCMRFLTSPYTAELLKTYTPPGAMAPTAPAGGGAP